MAFGFLKDVGDLVTGVSGIAGLFGDKDEPRASQAGEDALNEAIRLAKASADPNSKAFRNLVALEDEALRSAAVRQIPDYLKQAQGSRARGGFGGFVNPERRDETVMKALARSFQDAQDVARGNARATLQNAAGVLTGAGAGMQPIAQTQLTVQNQEAKRRLDLGDAIGAGIKGLGGILNERFPSPVPKPNETVVRLE